LMWGFIWLQFYLLFLIWK